MTVLDKNTRAIALYRRMGWRVCGKAETFAPEKDAFVKVPCALLVMQYEG